ncbi:MAG: polyhydroxyalkanoic acid system family protein [Candidatus Azambacteria bacterium]|nr:polyhydroxyalkanoic acid system family protein [Candidatus Azambacteria bacterium]
MAKLNMAVSHRLTQDEAVTRVKTLLGEVKNQFADKISDLREEWNGNTGKFSFSAMGFSVSGTLTVKSSEVELSGTLPFAASFFKGKIESTIRERAQALLA